MLQAQPLKKKRERERERVKETIQGVPTVAQWDQRHLWSSRVQVQALAQHSGLRFGVAATAT